MNVIIGQSLVHRGLAAPSGAQEAFDACAFPEFQEGRQGDSPGELARRTHRAERTRHVVGCSSYLCIIIVLFSLSPLNSSSVNRTSLYRISATSSLSTSCEICVYRERGGRRHRQNPPRRTHHAEPTRQNAPSRTQQAEPTNCQRVGGKTARE